MLRRATLSVAAIVVLAGLAWLFMHRWQQSADAGPRGARGSRVVPVELAPITRGGIVDRRTFSGTLIARAEFVVAPKVSGRIESLSVDIGDDVKPGDVVCELDDDEFEQAVAEAEAALVVAHATVASAQSALDVAESRYRQVRELSDRSIASGAELDVAEADLAGRRAELQVAEARVQQAEASLRGARVRLGYAKVTATWSSSESPRVVAERYVDEGATVRANDPIVTVVDVSSVRAVLFVTERDFASLQLGQTATVYSDAWPGEAFVGVVDRLAPVFQETSRQTRVEVGVPNPERKLRPGMFARVEVVLDEVADATLVPESAIVRRAGGIGVFVVGEPRDRVRFVPVETGIVNGGLVQVRGDRLAGDVVTLGQQLLEDGSAVRVATGRSAAGSLGDAR
ncbi:MAG: efflux RND transporter periplasmic adaptor subunit [Planctomycetes bacterium]|nr:efflux RND transporter periplasmic adaptor subunit [Planctomycetota bacterium]